MRSKARCSSPARPYNGCEMRLKSLTRPLRPTLLPAGRVWTNRSTWCRPSSVSAHPIGTPRRADCPSILTETPLLRVDGGVTASEIAMQFLADILACPVDQAAITEATALGAAWLAGYAAGICPDAESFARHYKIARRFEPRMDEEVRARKYAGWQDAVRRTLTRA